MNEKDFIKQYFEEHKIVKNKKIIYNESELIIASIFLFLVYMLIKSFSKSNSQRIESRINNNPEIPRKIMDNLEEIKSIIINDIKGVDLKYIFKIIDSINDNLEKIEKTRNKKELIETITDQLMDLLENITKLYFKQEEYKKNNLFKKIKDLLIPFGLVDVFNKLIELEIKKNNNTIINDKREPVKITPQDIKDIIKPVERQQDDQFDEDEDDDFDLEKELEKYDDENFDNDSEDQDEDEDREEEDSTNKTIDEIKKELLNKKNKLLSNIKNLEIKNILSYIFYNFNKFSEEDVYELYNLSKIDSDDFIEEFPQSNIYDKADELFKSELVPIGDYKKLLNYFDSMQIDMVDYNDNFFSIRIFADSYKFGTIRPVKMHDLILNPKIKYYYMLFSSENNNFFIAIKKDQQEDYEIIDKKIIFFIEQKENFFNANNITICQGKWSFIEEENRLILSKIQFKDDFEPLTKETLINRTFIAKREKSLIKEIINPNSISISEIITYYYCIKINNEIFIKEIEGDFISFLRSHHNEFWYKLNDTIHIFRFNEAPDIKEIMSRDLTINKTHSFLNKINKEGKISNKNFYKVKNSAIEDKDIIKINTRVANWISL
jgi:hypothetical protein